MRIGNRDIGLSELRDLKNNMDRINDVTGFANGDLWTSEEDLCHYFSESVQRELFGEEAADQELLDTLAHRVIVKGWHMDESVLAS